MMEPFSKIVDDIKRLTLSAKEAPAQMFNTGLNPPLNLF